MFSRHVGGSKEPEPERTSEPERNAIVSFWELETFFQVGTSNVRVIDQPGTRTRTWQTRRISYITVSVKGMWLVALAIHVNHDGQWTHLRVSARVSAWHSSKAHWQAGLLCAFKLSLALDSDHDDNSSSKFRR